MNQSDLVDYMKEQGLDDLACGYLLGVSKVVAVDSEVELTDTDLEVFRSWHQARLEAFTAVVDNAKDGLE